MLCVSWNSIRENGTRVRFLIVWSPEGSGERLNRGGREPGAQMVQESGLAMVGVHIGSGCCV